MKKNLNYIKIIILILIVVTILFAILGSFKRSKENMEDAPQCYSDLKSDVQCYADVLPSNDTDTEHAPYNESKSESIDDKYILKTKIIPPKGTSCPIEISSPASKYLNGITPDKSEDSASGASASGASAPGSTQIQSSSNLNTSNTSSSVTNITTIEGKNNTPVAADTASSTPSAVPGPSHEAIVQNTAALNEIKGSITQINQQKPKPETCPPCPACERCPEPAFDCKKVPNYRSPSIGQYLPMPILNDFSTF